MATELPGLRCGNACGPVVSLFVPLVHVGVNLRLFFDLFSVRQQYWPTRSDRSGMFPLFE